MQKKFFEKSKMRLSLQDRRKHKKGKDSMIEAPEARILCEQLNETVKGKRITDVFTQFTPHKFAFFSGSQEEYTTWLSGQTINRAQPQGGMVEITIGNKVLVLTDGVNLRYLPAGTKLPAKHQLLIAFEDESCLIASVRMYGGLMCYDKDAPGGHLSDYYLTAKSKRQVMSDEFDQTYFLGLINSDDAQKKSAKAFLATEQTIPGLGNGVLQDILYHAHIHPKKKIAELTANERENLYDRLKETMNDMYRLGGRSTESDLYGENGRYIPSLSKDTAGMACPHCGETIVKENYLGGSIYYCRGCQPL